MDKSISEKMPYPSTFLSPHQQDLLLAALNSNKSPDKPPAISTSNLHMSSTNSTDSPAQQTPGSATLAGSNESLFDEYCDFDADGYFDFDLSSAGGDESLHDKRGHPDDEEEEGGEGGGKRRNEKGSKKPGRKPLTSEPTSKRKAQNRAAQRAFRERKEKYLKDLEVKVQDLEKQSESANHENSVLRARVEKMSIQLYEYKKRVSLPAVRGSTLTTPLPPYLSGKGLMSPAANSPSDVNFQFDFPKFGSLPSPTPYSNGATSAGGRKTNSPTSAAYHAPGVVDMHSVNPRSQYTQTSVSVNKTNRGQHRADDMSSLSGLFSPSILENAGKPPFDLVSPNETDRSGSRTDFNGGQNGSGQDSSGQNTSYSSPSVSSNSKQGPNSSRTTPEPCTQLPSSTKPTDKVLLKIGEEQAKDEATFCEKLNMACGNPNNPIPKTLAENCGTSLDLGTASRMLQTRPTPAFDFDWFAQQNENQFNPVLLGNYRDPQDKILSNADFGDAYFNGSFALPAEFSSPFNLSPSPIPTVDLIQQIDDQQNADDEEVVPADTGKMLNCSSIWEQLQSYPEVQEESFDLNDLCIKLQRQAKCSETGAVVDEKAFKAIMSEYAKSDGSKPLTEFVKSTRNQCIAFGTPSQS